MLGACGHCSLSGYVGACMLTHVSCYVVCWVDNITCAAHALGILNWIYLEAMWERCSVALYGRYTRRSNDRTTAVCAGQCSERGECKQAVIFFFIIFTERGKQTLDSSLPWCCLECLRSSYYKFINLYTFLCLLCKISFNASFSWININYKSLPNISFNKYTNIMKIFLN